MIRRSVVMMSLGALALVAGLRPALSERTMITPRRLQSTDGIVAVRVHRKILEARRFSVSTEFGRLLANSDARIPTSGKVPTHNGIRNFSSRTGKVVPEGELRFDDYVVSRAFRGSGRYNLKHAIFSGAGDRAYVIARNNGRTVLKTVRKDLLPSCGGSPQRKGGTVSASHDQHSHRGESFDAPAADGEVAKVDAAIFYSIEAFRAAGGNTDAIAAEAASAVKLANKAYAQSGVTNLGLKLAYVGQLGSEVRKGHDEILRRVQDPSDGFYDDVHTIRRQVFADVVTYMVTSSQFCGLGYILSNPNDPTFRDLAFNTVNRECLANHSYVHEVGHNMGLDHNVEDSGGLPAYPFAYGHRFTGESGTQWRTAMAYAPGSRINQFSNPRLTYDGVSTGRDAASLAGRADNAQALTLTAPVVARFMSATDPALGPSVPETPVASALFSKVRAKLRGDACQISAGISDAQGTPIDNLFVALVDSANQELYAEKFSSDGKIGFRVNARSVRNINLQLVAEPNALSSTFRCPQPKKQRRRR
jgi:hypothetical protein